VKRPEGKRSHERPRCRWENNIKIYLQKVGMGDIDWIDLAEDRESGGLL
jgi:hypothetical protein